MPDVAIMNICCQVGGQRHQLHRQFAQAHLEAIALYKGSGYVEVKAFNAEPYAHHWFEKTLGKKTQTGKVQ